MDLRLDTAELGLVLTTVGGSVWRFFAKRDGDEVPLFRAPPAGPGRAAGRSGCFPLVPFGNRVRGNRFRAGGRTHGLVPNLESEPLYLHGDGWLGDWQVLDGGESTVRLGYEHRGTGTPYRYAAEQEFGLRGRSLVLTLRVTNTGDAALPFGLGWHPFFPLGAGTTLQASTRSVWDEDEHHLPTTERPVAGDLDFAAGAPLPRRWVNRQFEGWDGQAAIRWPERGVGLHVEADALFDRCIVFVSDPAFDPDYDYEFFCFEPMSHGVDAHNRADRGGLRDLAPGETLAGSVRFTLDAVPGSAGRA